jgi:hypothetical protein
MRPPDGLGAKLERMDGAMSGEEAMLLAYSGDVVKSVLLPRVAEF